MNKNKIKITIRKPIAEVFEFTTNPKNTHLWIPSISEEIAEEYPPKIGTLYKNRGKNSEEEVIRRINNFLENGVQKQS